MRAFDGQQNDLESQAPHWLIARALLDAVMPRHDAMVVAWYEATGTWMQQQLLADTMHLAHGRTLFPDAADLWFLSGCQHERLSTTSVQALARDSVLPQGVVLDIGSERSELADAERFFRRSVALDPSHKDAHLRLGHVLLTRGQFKDAADELQLVSTASSDRPLQYFASLGLSAQTGGQLFEVDKTADLKSLFTRILDEFRHRYLLSYTPMGVQREGWHRLEVRVNRKAVVNARPGYLGL